MNYFQELKKSMEWLSKQDKTIFIGQGVEEKGTGISNSLIDIPKNKLLEMPVIEEFQMGICNGMALDGHIPICIFPRWNFLFLAVNQLVNHLDKIPIYSDYRPRIIIRTAIGSINPLNPQTQHIGDFTTSFKTMLSTIEVIRLDNVNEIFSAYEYAYNRNDGKSTLLIEWADKYNN